MADSDGSGRLDMEESPGVVFWGGTCWAVTGNMIINYYVHLFLFRETERERERTRYRLEYKPVCRDLLTSNSDTTS